MEVSGSWEGREMGKEMPFSGPCSLMPQVNREERRSQVASFCCNLTSLSPPGEDLRLSLRLCRLGRNKSVKSKESRDMHIHKHVCYPESLMSH